MFDGKTPEEVRDYSFELIQKENDRGAALLAAMLTEHCLDLLIAGRLLPPAGQEKLISGFNSPIGSFSSKIELAYRIGIIPEGLAKLLDGLRKIRNSFAHETAADFDTPSIREKTENAFRTNPEHYEEFISSWSNDINKLLTEHGVEATMSARNIKTRVRFNNYFAQIVMHLNSYLGSNRQLDRCY